MYRLAVYGKGGIGKSTISANLSYLLSTGGSSVLHVGCDPKHDSARLLTGGETVRTFLSDTSADPICTGENGIMCVECGGPGPGRGCAGKALELLMSRLSDVDSDFRVYDVLGDVVCGGFSVPARASNADAVIIVTSGEMMSLYAANNILRGLENINPGPCVLGLVLNRRGIEGETERVSEFADAVGLPVLCDIPRSQLFADAEASGRVLCVEHPDSEEARILRGLADMIIGGTEGHRPAPLSEEDITAVSRGLPRSPVKVERQARKCSFDLFDTERNLTYHGEFVVPSCTSHGAADAAMRIRDAAVILHGPRNCAYLMEYAFRRRAIYGSSERADGIPDPGLYCTCMDAVSASSTPDELVMDAARRAMGDGYAVAFLIPTCASVTLGVDHAAVARRASAETGMDIIPVIHDKVFLGSKFGGTFGLFDALAGRMVQTPVEKGTVNLIARWFYGLGKDRSMTELAYILGLMGLKIKHRLLDFSTMSEIADFPSAEYDILLGKAKLNRRISERIADATGRRPALEMDVPTGLCRCLRTVRDIADYAPELAANLPSAEAALKERFEKGISAVRHRTEGRSAVIYCIVNADLEWQVETLRAMGMRVDAIIYAKGNVTDHNVRMPDYGDIPVMTDACMCDLQEVVSSKGSEIVLTNDPDRVGRKGYRWTHMGSRTIGIEGAIEWAETVADALHVIGYRWEEGL